jgi:hypothetical protein
MGYESERVAGIDRDAKHDDSHERPMLTDPGAVASLFARHYSGGFCGRGRGRYGFIGRMVRRFTLGRLQRTEKVVLLLGHTDSLHGTLSGPATKKLLERAWRPCSAIRATSGWRRSPWPTCTPCASAKPTSATASSGIRRAREHSGRYPARTGTEHRTGYLRIDSVHQDDRDSLKGIYHINAVDCVSQFESGVSPLRADQRGVSDPGTEGNARKLPVRYSWLHSDNGLAGINYFLRRIASWKMLPDRIVFIWPPGGFA